MRRQNRTYTQAPAAAAQAPAVAPTLSIESMSIDDILVGRAVLSIEEEVTALAEADQLADEVSKDVAETTRVEDVTDTMLNVAETLEGATEITSQQAELVDAASEMAVAGSDGDPDDVIPSAGVLLDPEAGVSVESFVEDIKKRAMEIWNRIKQFCIQIWNSIVEFFKRIFNAAPRLLHRIKELREVSAVKKKAGSNAQPKSGQVQVLVGGNSISYPDYMVRDSKELIKGLNELKTLATYANGPYMKDIKSMGEQVAAELNKFDPKKAAEHLKTCAQGLQRNNFTNLPSNPPAGYIGCFEVHATRLDKSKTKDLSDSQILGALRNSGVKLQARHGKAPLLNTKNGFQTMSYAECDSVMSAVEGLVKMLVASETSSGTKDVERARLALIAGGTHASTAVGNMQGDDEAGKAERSYAVDVMKGLANFNTTLTRWVSDLTMPVAKKIYQTSRTSLVLVEKSLSEYPSGSAPAAKAA